MNSEHKHSASHSSEHHKDHNSHSKYPKQIQWTNIILLASIGVLLFGLGYKYGNLRATGAIRSGNLVTNVFDGGSARKVDNNVDFTLFWDVWNKVQTKYVDEKKIDAKKMYYGAIKGMVSSVGDPYTFFLTPEENQKSKDDLGGKFEGIGAQLGLRDNSIVIVAPLKNSPAIKAGIQAGDIITKVDGTSTEGWTLSQAVNKIRGEKGTPVTLTVYRGGKEIDIKIVRDQIHIDSVELSYKQTTGKNIAVVKVNQFGETTTKEWDTAVDDVAAKYASGAVQGMVLDLRNNPGGYLEASVYLASEFLPQGKLVVKQESTTEGNREYNVSRDGKLLDIPVVVLINEGSASASEILSGALRDHGRATLIGQKSFGKGSVQEALDLEGGAGLHVTIAKWILPKGDWINGKGIKPAIEVKNEISEGNTLTDDTDTQLQRALQEVSK